MIQSTENKNTKTVLDLLFLNRLKIVISKLIKFHTIKPEVTKKLSTILNLKEMFPLSESGDNFPERICKNW